MTKQDFADQLNALILQDDFQTASEQLVDGWVAQGIGCEAVEPILRFMEVNPSVSIGLPGALVHFVERFYHNGYEDSLLESIKRIPVVHTIWMLNRLINGTISKEVRGAYVLELEKAKANQFADAAAQVSINHFLEQLKLL